MSPADVFYASDADFLRASYILVAGRRIISKMCCAVAPSRVASKPYEVMIYFDPKGDKIKARFLLLCGLALKY